MSDCVFLPSVDSSKAQEQNVLGGQQQSYNIWIYNNMSFNM